MSALPSALPVPRADAPVAEWHISPTVDALAYHWSWLLFFAPLWFAGPKHWSDYVVIWMFGSTISFAHRHLTMPYVYGDPDVFSRHVARFTVFPVFVVTGFLLTPGMQRWTVPKGWFGLADVAVVALAVAVAVFAFGADRRGHAWSRAALAGMALVMVAGGAAIGLGLVPRDHAAATAAAAAALGALGAGLAVERARATPDARGRYLPLVGFLGLALAAAIGLAGPARVLPSAPFKFQYVFAAIATFAALWNIWHVYMQKFGIFRIYAAKSPLPPERRTPPWADRWLVFGWVPLYFVWFARYGRAELAIHAKSILVYVQPIADTMDAIFPVAFPAAVALVVASVATWTWQEWKASRLASVPRLSMMLGTTGLAAAVLLAPVKGYMAFGFSHAVEYIVFVWAFQRRRYAQPLAHDPWIGRALRYPWLAYAAFFLVVSGGSFAFEFGRYLKWLDASFRPLGTSPGSWLFYWTVWQSLAHFWYDGFLWKMRLPTVRASL